MTPNLAITQVPIDDLVPDPANPRHMDEAELESLTRSVQQFGFVDPVIARREDLRVIGGDKRLLVGRRLGITTVPVIFVDLSDEQADLLNLALNKISGDRDEGLLAQQLAKLKPKADLDLNPVWVRRGRHPAAAQEPGDTRQARPGGAIRPGSGPGPGHGERASRPAQRSLAARGAPPALWGCHQPGRRRPAARRRPGPDGLHRPPYNVGYGDHGGQQRGQPKRKLQNDALAPADWAVFCAGWVGNLATSVDGAIYCCMNTREWPVVTRLLAEAGVHWSDTLVWMKDRFVLGRAPYQRQYEPIFFGWPERAKPFWCGDRDQGDVWQIPRPAVSDAHPTQKPLALAERAITNS